ADTSLFVFHQKSDTIYLLLYVDDVIITGNNSSLLDNFARKLNSEFATKDLDSLSYFLGLEATLTFDGLFISQLKYARDILTRAQLLDSKSVHTPMVIFQHLTSDGPAFSDRTLYRSLVGALQYLTTTHPDIAHAVNSVSQFLHAPTTDHFLAVKRILRYVKGTLHFGLTFRPSAASGDIVAYSDVDWAGCPDTRRSTSGYSIYLGDNLVSWSAKKQPTVFRSSCESEYRALATTAIELLWLTHLLHDLKVVSGDDTRLATDLLKYPQWQVNGLSTCHSYEKLCASPTEGGLMCHRIHVCCNYENVFFLSNSVRYLLLRGRNPYRGRHLEVDQSPSPPTNLNLWP
ncbi:hypothetical protein F2P56_007299, partial [Juglans regia]